MPKPLFSALLLTLMLSGCGSAGFSGGGNSNGSTTGKTEPTDTPRDDDALVDTDKQCLELFDESRIEFENLAANVEVTTAYLYSHGVLFSSAGSGSIVSRQTTVEGDNELDSSVEAWNCALCEGSPKYNRLADSTAAARVGSRVLANSEYSNDNKNGGLKVTWLQPVSNIKFDLLDVDGSEVWTVTFFDKDRNLIKDATKEISFKGYNVEKTGNGKPTEVFVSLQTPQIKSMEIHGVKNIKAFGFGFDNFHTGLVECE